MRTVTMLGSSVDFVVRFLIPEEHGRNAERTWLSAILRHEIVRGDMLVRHMRRAPGDLVKIRASRESRAFRRAVALGHPIHLLGTESFLCEGRCIRLGDAEEQATMGDLLDWLLSLHGSDPRLLGRISRVSLPQAIRHTRRWHEALRARNERDRLRAPPAEPDRIDPRWHPIVDVEPARTPSSGRSSTFLETGDGRRWLRHEDADALDAESRRMGHCLGYGGYDAAVGAGTTFILSLRSREDDLFCTVEWHPSSLRIAQIKGRGNAPFEEGCLEDVRLLVDHLRPNQVMDIRLNRLVTEQEDDGAVRVTGRMTKEEAADLLRREQEERQRLQEERMARMVAVGHGMAGAVTRVLGPMYPRLGELMNLGLLNRPFLVLGEFPSRNVAPILQPPLRRADRTDGDGRFSRTKRTRALSWTDEGRQWTIGYLKSVAGNPDLSPDDRREARERMKRLLAPAG